jgi:hypothetical protein
VAIFQFFQFFWGWGKCGGKASDWWGKMSPPPIGAATEGRVERVIGSRGESVRRGREIVEGWSKEGRMGGKAWIEERMEGSGWIVARMEK